MTEENLTVHDVLLLLQQDAVEIREIPILQNHVLSPLLLLVGNDSYTLSVNLFKFIYFFFCIFRGLED